VRRIVAPSVAQMPKLDAGPHSTNRGARQSGTHRALGNLQPRSAKALIRLNLVPEPRKEHHGEMGY
jgi:hypothetical protein